MCLVNFRAHFVPLVGVMLVLLCLAGYFDQLHNAVSSINDDDHSDPLYPNDHDYCKYYTPDEFSLNVGRDSNNLSMFCINCRSINANWGSFTELILNISSDRFHFDFIGLTEVCKVHDGTNYSIEGYHDIESNTKGDTGDGHGGVALYIYETMSFFRRDDLSIFIPHVIETIFFEIKVNETKSVIVGVTYRPNSFPHADIDLFIQKITEVANIISLENKESYLMGDFNIDLLKFQTHDKTNDFINCMITTGFLPVITKPSRITDHSATLIDHIIILQQHYS